MKPKTKVAILGTVAGAVLGIAAGVYAGVQLGGNYFTDFQFGGLRGYEATGAIGFYLGALMGGTAGGLLAVRWRFGGKSGDSV